MKVYKFATMNLALDACSTINNHNAIPLIKGEMNYYNEDLVKTQADFFYIEHIDDITVLPGLTSEDL